MSENEERREMANFEVRKGRLSDAFTLEKQTPLCYTTTR